MDEKKEITLPCGYLMEIIRAYEDRGYKTVSLDDIKKTTTALHKNGLSIYKPNSFGSISIDWDLDMYNHELYYLVCYKSNYSLTDLGREFLEESIIPIAGSQRRIFYETIGNIPFCN